MIQTSIETCNAVTEIVKFAHDIPIGLMLDTNRPILSNKFISLSTDNSGGTDSTRETDLPYSLPMDITSLYSFFFFFFSIDHDHTEIEGNSDPNSHCQHIARETGRTCNEEAGNGIAINIPAMYRTNIVL